MDLDLLERDCACRATAGSHRRGEISMMNYRVRESCRMKTARRLSYVTKRSYTRLDHYPFSRVDERVSRRCGPPSKLNGMPPYWNHVLFVHDGKVR